MSFNNMMQKFRSFSVVGQASEQATSALASFTPAVEPKYFIPRSQRSSPTDVFKFASTVDERLARGKRTDPTRELNYTHKHWEEHKSVNRRFRHMRTIFSSSPFQRLAFPDLSLTAATAIGLTYYNTEIATDYASQLLLDGSAMAGASTAVGLLAAFRLNASYGRYDEGRKFWGEINNACRDLAGNGMMWIESQKEKDRMLNFIKAFPVVMHFHLNEKGGHYLMRKNDPNYREQLYSEFHAEMKDIYKDEEDVDFIQICEGFREKQHLPLKVTSGMRQIIAQNAAWVDPIYNKQMDEQLRRLVACMGQCERVLRTPMPTCFTRHTSRIFFLWSNLLPFAMYAGCGPLGTLPASLLVSYAVLGIEDIGVQLEEPFNILPIRQYSEGIYAGVDTIRDGFLSLPKHPEAIATPEEVNSLAETASLASTGMTSASSVQSEEKEEVSRVVEHTYYDEDENETENEYQRVAIQ